MCDWKNYSLEEREDRLARMLGFSFVDEPQGEKPPIDLCWLDLELEELRTEAHTNRTREPRTT